MRKTKQCFVLLNDNTAWAVQNRERDRTSWFLSATETARQSGAVQSSRSQPPTRTSNRPELRRATTLLLKQSNQPLECAFAKPPRSTLLKIESRLKPSIMLQRCSPCALSRVSTEVPGVAPLHSSNYNIYRKSSLISLGSKTEVIRFHSRALNYREVPTFLTISPVLGPKK